MGLDVRRGYCLCVSCVIGTMVRGMGETLGGIALRPRIDAAQSNVQKEGDVLAVVVVGRTIIVILSRRCPAMCLVLGLVGLLRLSCQ